MSAEILKVKNLATWFTTDEGLLKAVDGIDFSIGAGTVLGLIGESGCGKSVTAQSILQLVPSPGRIVSGEILFTRRDGEVVDLAKLDPMGRTMRGIRGRDISMVFQEPMTSLSPIHTIGNQVGEIIYLHMTQDAKEVERIAVDMLARVGIPNPQQRFREYPHQLSGGMRQRAMIAMALACRPSLLIADEPTTALDVTVQAQILKLMRHLQEQLGMAILYITHDLGVIARIAYEVNVAYLGRIVERASTRELFRTPLHPYTTLLLKSIPKVGRKARVRLDAIKGTVPIPLDPPRRCGFFGRCPRAMAGTCDKAVPALVEREPGHSVRCFLYGPETEAENAARSGRGDD